MRFSKIKYIDRKTKEVLIENPTGEKLLEFLYYNQVGKQHLK